MKIRKMRLRTKKVEILSWTYFKNPFTCKKSKVRTSDYSSTPHWYPKNEFQSRGFKFKACYFCYVVNK